jgi:hypothetical protein
MSLSGDGGNRQKQHDLLRKTAASTMPGKNCA